MQEVRPIDANALIRDIAESIRQADEWEKESYENGDECGLKYAVDTRRSLLAMISRVKEAPTIKPQVRHGRWIVNGRNPDYVDCTNCGLSEWIGANGSRSYAETLLSGFKKYCPNCGARMDATYTNVGCKGG